MIYFDNSATTKMDKTVLETVSTVSQDLWGNPSSLNKMGEKSHELLEQSRHQIASILSVKDDEIIFTSGGTEGNNLVIKGTAFEKKNYGKHIITSLVEHPSVLETMRQLEKLGYEVTYLPVNEDGLVNVNELKKAIQSNTILVSIMSVNNEIGSIQPIVEIANILTNHPKVHFHVDAVQAVGKGLEKIFMHDRVDFVTFSGHKFHGPRGVGFIYAKKGRKIMPLLNGGGQELNLRSGTENVSGIAGLAKAFRITLEDEDTKVQNQISLRDEIYHYIRSFDKVKLFTANNNLFAPHIICFAIQGLRGENIVRALQEKDIYISTTSACFSKKQQVSHTLFAMNVDEDVAKGAVRISLNENNTIEEVNVFKTIFKQIYYKFTAVI